MISALWLGLGGSDKKLLGNLPIHKFATGGIMPGYAPGIDRHQIMVGGGEAILRPEVTKALGHDEIHSWNRAAIRGGIGGVENVLGRNMRRYATGGIVWPTNTKALSGDYKGHTGVDIRAGYGAPVFAAHAGRVFATPRLGYSYGHHVKIAGTDGIQTIYAHLSRILTKVGANVKAGTRIGNVGSTGNSSGPHLHFEVRPGQTRSAALKYLNNGTIPKGGGTNSLLDSLSGAAKSAIKNPVKYLQNLVGDGFKKVPLSGEAMSLMKAVPKKFYSSIAEKLKKAAMKALDIGKGFFNLSPAGMAAKGVKALIGGRGPTPKLYDQGGYLPPGLSTVINRTGKPEPVFSPDQWAKMSAGGSGFVQNNHFTTKPLSADELVDQLAFEGRRAKRSGTVSRKGNK